MHDRLHSRMTALAPGCFRGAFFCPTRHTIAHDESTFRIVIKLRPFFQPDNGLVHSISPWNPQAKPPLFQRLGCANQLGTAAGKNFSALAIPLRVTQQLYLVKFLPGNTKCSSLENVGLHTRPRRAHRPTCIRTRPSPERLLHRNHRQHRRTRLTQNRRRTRASALANIIIRRDDHEPERTTTLPDGDRRST